MAPSANTQRCYNMGPLFCGIHVNGKGLGVRGGGCGGYLGEVKAVGGYVR